MSNEKLLADLPDAEFILPNVEYIDWVIQSSKNNPEEWEKAWNAAWDDASYEIMSAAQDSATERLKNELTQQFRETLWIELREDTLKEASMWAFEVIDALFIYDDYDADYDDGNSENIESYFNSTYEELKIIARLTRHPAANLLLTALKARELIEQKTLQNS